MKNYLILALIFLASCKPNDGDLYVGRYKAVMTQAPKRVPTTKTPDGALAGNGDIGIVLGGAPNHLTFYFGKNDFWRAHPVYPGGGIALPGSLELSIDALDGADYLAENVFDAGCINGRFTKDKLQVSLKSWVTATHNTAVIELKPNEACTARLNLIATEGNTSVNSAGCTGEVMWVTRSFENTPYLEWDCHVALALSAPGASICDNMLELPAGKTTTIAVTMYTNIDDANWKERALAEAASLTEQSLSAMWKEHIQWWRDFWGKSNVQIGDEFLEKYYYASQYMLASCTRGDKFAPGIWGNFVTQDSSAWGGDYHLNYNYQSPFWGFYSSNHIDLLESFDQPLLDYMDEGRRLARELLGIRGIYYPVGLGPKGLCTTRWPLTEDEMERRYATRENTIDGGYKILGQKINAVFSVGNMLMRFYSTYDSEYARKVYPYMLACADFWEDYLKLEDGRYVIYMDHFNEVMPNRGNGGQWRQLLGDFNSTLSLGLVRMLFQGMLDVSAHLQTDADRHAKWKDICERLSAYPVGETEDGRLALKNVEMYPGGRNSRPSGLNRVSIHGLILPAGVCGPNLTPELNEIFLSDVSRWGNRSRQPGDWGNTFGNGIETCFPAAVRVGYDPDFILDRLKERLEADKNQNLWIVAAGGGIETLAAVPLTVNEMLLQSYEHIVRIFPVWNKERNASFDNLRAYGAFLVSGSLKDGKVEYVRLLSEQGRVCKMENPWKGKEVQVYRKGKPSEILSEDVFELMTAKGEKLELKEK